MIRLSHRAVRCQPVNRDSGDFPTAIRPVFLEKPQQTLLRERLGRPAVLHLSSIRFVCSLIVGNEVLKT